MMVKGAKPGFEATFRVVAYGYSANIFMVIPFCGGILPLVWAVVLSIIGLREAHETTGGKAAFAVFLPADHLLRHVLFALALPGSGSRFAGHDHEPDAEVGEASMRFVF